MLLTVTSNTTIDRTLFIPHLTPGAVHRATTVHLAAGGKGLNVTRAARVLGYEVVATGPLAGMAGQIVADLAVAEGLRTDWHWLAQGETRTCTLINHDGGDTTVINEQGPTLSAEDWAGFAAHVQRVGQSAKAVAFAGSVPLGIAPEALGELARSLVTPQRAVYVDTSAAALAAVLAQPQGLCIKVNRGELAGGLGLEPNGISLTALIHEAQRLVSQGAALVVVSLGSEGALMITAEGQVWKAIAPSLKVVSTVGSGDSMLAGLVVSWLREYSLPEALTFSVACGSANVMSTLPGRFERGQVEALRGQVEVTQL
jgi:1-phosphofructokinase family hexose kinase